jgi:hypothetical protein
MKSILPASAIALGIGAAISQPSYAYDSQPNYQSSHGSNYDPSYNSNYGSRYKPSHSRYGAFNNNTRYNTRDDANYDSWTYTANQVAVPALDRAYRPNTPAYHYAYYAIARPEYLL